jgi:hypothetical protein
MADGVRAPRPTFVRGDIDSGVRLIAHARTASRFIPVLLVIAVAQLLDLVTFWFAVERWGIGGELGPLSVVYEAAGYWAVAALKTAMIVFVIAAIYVYPWQRVATAWRMGLLIGAIGAFGAATNVAAIVS